MGVIKVTLTPGDGFNFPKANDTITVHHTGYLVKSGTGENIVLGTVIDSSHDRGEPFRIQIGVGRVIKGWDGGVPQMSLGERATLEITPDYGYGIQGFPDLIPANSTLFFKAELLAINDKKASK